MTIVITTYETNERTGKKQLVASHGIDQITGKNITLPSEPPQDLGATFDNELREWVLANHNEGYTKAQAPKPTAHEKKPSHPRFKVLAPAPQSSR